MNNTTHPLYRTWAGMRERCHNPNADNYERYGGRGITVDPRWDDFATFVSDMGPKPSLTHTLDRIDNDGPYEPGNCRWATVAEQNQHTRVRSDSSTGHTGVHWHKKNQTYVAYIYTDGQRIHLGSFTTLESAVNARTAAKALYHG